MGTFKLSSPSFQHNQMIPSKYTCDGEDVNPALRIEAMPPQTKSLALVVDDPDAPSGMWVHWIVWNIDPAIAEIPESSLPAGAEQGTSDFRKTAYGCPCPPSGTHRYFFKLYALDGMMNLPRATNKAGLEKAMKGRILGQAELIGLYKRR